MALVLSYGLLSVWDIMNSSTRLHVILRMSFGNIRSICTNNYSDHNNITDLVEVRVTDDMWVHF